MVLPSLWLTVALLGAAGCGSGGARNLAPGTSTPPMGGPTVSPVAGIGAAARFFPDTRDRVMVFTDQLPGGMTDAQYQFAATHYVGSQKLPPRGPGGCGRSTRAS
jgi:hypothetical protein